ncbi:MAG: SDR family oxidoreductase, partial [Pseudomonadota bacterium]
IYCASKFALEGLTKAMAIELAPNGIRANTVGPTYIETDLTRPSLTDPDQRDGLLARIPMGRFGQVDDVTGAIVFLASDAASLITGTSLVVDGGWTAI